jgi:hypothetical protein
LGVVVPPGPTAFAVSTKSSLEFKGFVLFGLRSFYFQFWGSHSLRQQGLPPYQGSRGIRDRAATSAQR